MSAPCQPPCVSVVIASFDRRECVAEAVESVLSQTGVCTQVLVIDDGSTDGTTAMLGSRFAADSRVLCLEQAHAGVASARNLGLQHVRGQFVVFLDSDDLLLPGALASQVALLTVHPDAQMALSDAWVEGVSACERHSCDPTARPLRSLANMFDGGWCLLPCCMLGAKTAASLAFREDYPVSSDTEFQFRFFIAGHRCVENPQPLALVRRDGRVRGAPALSSDGMGRLAARLRMMREHRAHAPDRAQYRRVELHLCRRLAKELTEQGRMDEAWPYVVAWLRRRPWRLGVWRRLLQGALRTRTPSRAVAR